MHKLNTTSPAAIPFSRREFLRFGTLSVLSLLPAPTLAQAYLAPGAGEHYAETQQGHYGRCLELLNNVFEEPNRASKIVHTYSKDSILPLKRKLEIEQNGAVELWYQIQDQAFVNASAVQPVAIDFNPVQDHIPSSRLLAEVTVPYTQAYPYASYQSVPTYRYYYSATFWVNHTYYDENGRAWYEVKEDLKPGTYYYVPARHLRILTEEDLLPISAQIPLEEKRIEVSLSDQKLLAFENNEQVFEATVSTGEVNKHSSFETPTGEYHTFYKRPSHHLAAGNLAYDGYDLPGVPWVCYFREDGHAFHGAYWHNQFGTPKSHGCVNLAPKDAQWVYRWTQPYLSADTEMVYNSDLTLGTRVIIF